MYTPTYLQLIYEIFMEQDFYEIVKDFFYTIYSQCDDTTMLLI